MPKLEVRGVDVEYHIHRARTTLVALRSIDIEVDDHEFVSVIGPSGCGKSTLLAAVHGLIPVRRGRILLDGKKVTRGSHSIATVFQSPSLLPWRNVRANIAYGLELQGIGDRATRRARADELIKLVGLTGFENSFPAELSGGMQQRVNIARALAVDPGLLLLDEPFAALDAQTRETMQRELLSIWGAARKTALFVTHQIDEAVYLSDRVVVLSARPGTIRDIVPIHLDRPRELKVKRTPQFIEYVERLATLIDEEGSKAQPLAGAAW